MKTISIYFASALMIISAVIGVVMTKEVRIKSSRTEVLNNADAVEAFLTGDIDMLKGWRTTWYNI